MIWCDLVQNPPSWVKSFLPRQVKFLTAAECSPPDASQPRQTTLAKFPSSPTLGVRAVSQPRWLTRSTLVSASLSGSWRPGERELPANTPSAPNPEILQRGNTEEGIFPPPSYILSPGGATAPPAQPLTQPAPLLLVPVREGPAHGTRSHRGHYPESSTEILRAAGAPDKDRNQPNRDWPFTISDFYRWKASCPPFLENPSKVIGLLESLFINHQPTWDDCQQLLKIFLTAEERDLVQIEVRKLFPGPTGVPTKLEPLIDAAFPINCPEWDYNTYEVKRNLLVYRQVLLAGLRAATHTNRSKIWAVTQRADENQQHSWSASRRPLGGIRSTIPSPRTLKLFL